MQITSHAVSRSRVPSAGVCNARCVVTVVHVKQGCRLSRAVLCEWANSFPCLACFWTACDKWPRGQRHRATLKTHHLSLGRGTRQVVPAARPVRVRRGTEREGDRRDLITQYRHAGVFFFFFFYFNFFFYHFFFFFLFNYFHQHQIGDIYYP